MAAENRMGELGLTQETLAKTAGVDPTTVNGFLNGRNWPQPRTRAKLEVALDWPVGMLARIDAGEEPPAAVEGKTTLTRAEAILERHELEERLAQLDEFAPPGTAAHAIMSEALQHRIDDLTRVIHQKSDDATRRPEADTAS